MCMATVSHLITVSILVEQDEEALVHDGRSEDDELTQLTRVVTAAIAALYAGQEGTVVKWQSLTTVPLDGNPAVGRCAVCNRWVYDVENATEWTPTGISCGAVVGGQYLCDEHLPPGHPHCFMWGYDGPVPPPKN
jgi:hypothetical protein